MQVQPQIPGTDSVGLITIPDSSVQHKMLYGARRHIFETSSDQNLYQRRSVTVEIYLSSITIAAPLSLTDSITDAVINNVSSKVLIDTGGSESYTPASTAGKYKRKMEKPCSQIRMTRTLGHSSVNLQYREQQYIRIKLCPFESLLERSPGPPFPQTQRSCLDPLSAQ